MNALAGIVLCLVVVVGSVGCGRGSEDRKAAVAITDAKDAARILEQTPWLDRAPTDERDIVHAWIFSRGEGVYFVGNAYKGAYEMFRYFVEEDELRIKFLDDGKSARTRFRIERFDDRVFDYRLTLTDSPRGPEVYYGFEPSRRNDLPLPARLRAMVSALPGR